MNNDKRSGSHIGSASIMLIFAVLSIISFATLTLVNSKADYNLSNNLYERHKQYYEACHRGNAFVAAVNSGFIDNEKNGIISESVPITDNQTLDIAIMLNSSKSIHNSDNIYPVVMWRVVNHDDLEYDYSLPVMK